MLHFKQAQQMHVFKYHAPNYLDIYGFYLITNSDICTTNACIR